MLLYGQLNGLGVIPRPFILPGAGGDAGTIVEPGHETRTGLNPYNPPAQNTRFMIRAMGDLNRIFVSNRANAVRNALVGQVPLCAQGKSTAEAEAACGAFLSPEAILMPLGVIDIFGVSFPADELLTVGEDGKLEKSYVPDGMQHFEIDAYVYLISQFELTKALGSELSDAAFSNFENVVADFDSDGRYMATEADRKAHGISGIISRSDKSVGWWTSGSTSRWTTRLDGYRLNPIDPTEEELTEPNGLYNYYQRGGYLLDKETASGKISLRRQGLKFNVGYFQCPDGKLAAISEKIPDEGHGWLVFATVGPTYKIRVQMKDRSTWDSVKNGVKAAVGAAFNLMCKAQPIAMAVGQAAMTTGTCAGPQGPCTQGSPGCVCSPPPSATSKEALAVAVGAAVLTKACGSSPPGVIPSCQDLLPPPMQTAWYQNPLVWLAAAGVVGFILYQRRAATQ